ncbi:muscle LIM protein Mlp84B-like isoform X1 [Hermetia illucens]|uniref:muscle LIM protein Mlp84B-like isoform X1 n=1 Tax=Hermetia illucens TaxID=343691 RepID=UPI0018CC2625|nr:muscle LIM protein Mlp84B-like isoform X1 [Hermetia illucens]XP_037914917.1 muscle LIM protein Mlp84B-like isoform X1 [Hermetia illucens]XP_037914918.1 muscle LIM protein Mlp84B-like isoform X1 [Hermetia illucens]
MPFTPVETPKCPKCGKSVYAAEERVAGGYKFHKTCFKCGMCNKALDSTNCTEHDKELFCKNCHARKYGPKGYGFGGGAGCLSMDTGSHLQTDGSEVRNGARLEPRVIAKAPEGQGCPRCGGYVYAAEQMLARGRGYHRRCFKCLLCNRTLDSTMHCDGPDKEIYCRGCYAQKFGARGYGHTGASSLGLMCDIKDAEWQSDMAPKTTVIDTSIIKAPPGQGCPRCGGVVFAAEQVLSKGREWHRKCFKCKDCTKTLDSIIACDGPDKDVYCKTCYGKKWGPHGFGFACGSGFLQTDGLTEDEISAQRPFYNPDTTSIKAPEGQGCPRCGGMVFAAEQQLAKGTMWHKKCFNCAECHRPLDSMLACDGPDKEIHCKACYGKLFGPKGFGYGHTPTLVSTSGESTVAFPEGRPFNGPKSQNGCPRCGFAVYAAEQMISKSRIWHKRCFHCADCRKSLDSTNLNDGPDGDIYCRSCYGRNFGPKGVGYGLGAGTLTMA